MDFFADYYICIPFRSHIRHKNAFLFHGTERSKRTQSGLDYTKIVLIDKMKYHDYMDAKNVVVDQDEYREVQRKYQYSTLPYFHDIMRIKVSA